jgi:hypothetical protein
MYGSDSYAGNLENRIVTQTWISYHRRKGRFTFKRIYDTNTDRYGRSNMIGFEMTTSNGYRNNTSDDNWVVRTYQDGTALYRMNKLRHMLNRRTCFNPINEVMDKHYYLDTTIPTTLERDYGNQGEIRILRRKPLSPYANLLAKRGSLGQFLVNKYNQREVSV